MTNKNLTILHAFCMAIIVSVSGCGLLSSAAPDAVAAIEVADKLNQAMPETPEVPQAPEMPQVEMPQAPEVPQMPEAPQIPDASQAFEAQQLPEAPDMSGMASPPEAPDMTAMANLPENSVAYHQNDGAAPMASHNVRRTGARIIDINLHAADYLNVDASGRSLALITKIYKLKHYAAFQQAPYGTFLDSQKEKDTLGADLVEVKETTLVPGQRYHAEEILPGHAGFIGIVGLFRAPAKGYWRSVFSAKQAAQTGITIGMLGCSIAVGKGLEIVAENQEKAPDVSCQLETNAQNDINNSDN